MHSLEAYRLRNRGSMCWHTRRGRDCQLLKVLCKLASCWCLKDKAACQFHAVSHCCLQLVAKLNSSERVETCLHQWCIYIYRCASGTAYQLKHSVKAKGSTLDRGSG